MHQSAFTLNKQSVSQLVNALVRMSVSQSVSQLVNPLVRMSVSQSTHWLGCQSVSQSEGGREGRREEGSVMTSIVPFSGNLLKERKGNEIMVTEIVMAVAVILTVAIFDTI